MPVSILEETILSEILNNDRRSVVDQIPDSKYFKKEECRAIFDAILSIRHREEDIGFDVVASEIRSMKNFPDPFKKQCTEKLKDIEKEIYYFHEANIDSLFNKYIAKAITETGKKLVNFGDDYSPHDAARDMIATLSIIENTGKNFDGLSYELYKQNYVKMIEDGNLLEDPGVVLNKQVNRMVFGDLYPGYYIIAGRPSMGKTQIANNLIADLCCIDGMCGIYFSLENKKAVAAKSIMSIETLIKSNLFRKNQIDKSGGAVIRKTYRKEENLWIYDDHVSVEEIRRVVEKTKAKRNVKWVVIDYFQILKRPGKRPQTEELEYMSKYLSRIPSELDVMVFLLSQVNDRDENKKTEQISFQMGELKGTGGLEANADFILGIEGIRRENNKTLYVAKNRWGPVNRFNVTFQKDIGIMSMNYPGGNNASESQD